MNRFQFEVQTNHFFSNSLEISKKKAIMEKIILQFIEEKPVTHIYTTFPQHLNVCIAVYFFEV